MIRKKRILRVRLLYVVLAVLLIAIAAILIVYFSNKNQKGTFAEATVVRASLSSNLSSTGNITNLAFDTEVPLAALVLENADKLSDITENSYTVNLIKLLSEGSQGPILYRVSWIDETMIGKKTTFSTEDAAKNIITLVPIYFDWEKASDRWAIEVSMGTTDAENVKEYVVSLLLREGFSSVDPSAFPDDFWREDTAAAQTITSTRLGTLILNELEHVEDIEFTISHFTWQKGDVLLLDNDLFTLSYSELFVSFVLSEYDVASIHARLQKDERVYASVSINALSGRRLISEIITIEQGKTVSGVAYFTLLARLVFPDIITNADGTTADNYTYYDSFLSDNNVAYLGLDLSDNLTENEILEGYSVIVSAQKTVVQDTLIIPTKCIYYDDAKRPYVAVLDADKKEKRVYIKITLSTGTDAAVVAADGYTLNEGDVLRYIADSTLIGSLF
ncbi:MAG: hypothetical protein E7639_00385 [Ruminococcaceae bacterium]|nr:hypothetical protein [Oscillospiraceae bacterium]